MRGPGLASDGHRGTIGWKDRMDTITSSRRASGMNESNREPPPMHEKR
jgi:hypothetical protein